MEKNYSLKENDLDNDNSKWKYQARFEAQTASSNFYEMLKIRKWGK